MSPCSDFTSCVSCYSNSTACHWCSFDQECHAIGSYYGCAYGETCYNIDSCFRAEPQKISSSSQISDDVSISPKICILIIFMTLTLITCCSCGLCVARQVKLAFESMLDDINRPPDSPTDYEMQRLQPSHKKPRTRSLDDDDSNASYDELVPFPSATTLGSNTSSNTNTTSKYHVSCLYNSCKAFYLFSIACLIAVATTLLIVYPTAPIYNICSDEMDWKR